MEFFFLGVNFSIREVLVMVFGSLLLQDWLNELHFSGISGNEFILKIMVSIHDFCLRTKAEIYLAVRTKYCLPGRRIPGP